MLWATLASLTNSWLIPPPPNTHEQLCYLIFRNVEGDADVLDQQLAVGVTAVPGDGPLHSLPPTVHKVRVTPPPPLPVSAELHLTPPPFHDSFLLPIRGLKVKGQCMDTDPPPPSHPTHKANHLYRTRTGKCLLDKKILFSLSLLLQVLLLLLLLYLTIFNFEKEN